MISFNSDSVFDLEVTWTRPQLYIGDQPLNSIFDTYMVRLEEQDGGIITTRELAKTVTRTVFNQLSLFNIQLRISVHARNDYGLSDSLEVYFRYGEFIIILLHLFAIFIFRVSTIEN